MISWEWITHLSTEQRQEVITYSLLESLSLSLSFFLSKRRKKQRIFSLLTNQNHKSIYYWNWKNDSLTCFRFDGVHPHLYILPRVIKCSVIRWWVHTQILHSLSSVCDLPEWPNVKATRFTCIFCRTNERVLLPVKFILFLLIFFFPFFFLLFFFSLARNLTSRGS